MIGFSPLLQTLNSFFSDSFIMFCPSVWFFFVNSKIVTIKESLIEKFFDRELIC